MMKPSIMITMTSLGSFLVGAGAGYIVASKQFEQRLEKETAGMREFYQTVKKPFATPQEAAAALIISKGNAILDDDVDSQQESTATRVGDKIAYHKIVKQKYVKEDEVQIDLPEQDDRIPVDAIKHQNLFVEQPHIISQEEFMQNDSGYEQSTLTFYRGDFVLTD